jgi:hypothetical protein
LSGHEKKQRPESLLSLPQANAGLLDLFTALIAHRAGSLACGLTGSLALAASALLHGFLQIAGRKCFDMLHLIQPPYVMVDQSKALYHKNLICKTVF